MYIILIILIILILLLLYYVFDINIKKIKKLSEDNSLKEISEKIPTNKEVCKNILDILNHKQIKIEEDDQANSSLYIAIFDKIVLGKMKIDYIRVQTIAHECVHATQSKKMQMFNFIFSNIYLIYYIVCIFLTIFGILTNYSLQIFILTLFAFIHYIIRSFLEIDAMTKAPWIAEKYLNLILNKEESEQLLQKYDIINKLGVPFVCFNIVANSLVKILLYLLIVQFMVLM